MFLSVAFVVGRETFRIQSKSLRTETKNLEIQDGEDVDVLWRPDRRQGQAILEAIQNTRLLLGFVFYFSRIRSLNQFLQIQSFKMEEQTWTFEDSWKRFQWKPWRKPPSIMVDVFCRSFFEPWYIYIVDNRMSKMHMCRDLSVPSKYVEIEKWNDSNEHKG